MLIKEFSKYLKNIKYSKNDPTWDIKGILGNQEYRFDVRSLKDVQKFTTGTRADKIAFDMPEKWVVVDTKELHDYLIKNKATYIELEEIISNLDWNIIINKNEV